MRFCVLGSGSKGNATWVEAGGTSLLIDCGFSGREIEQRLQSIGRSAESLDSILVTHEHTDHIRGVGVVSRRYQVPVHINGPTLEAATTHLGRLASQKFFVPGEPFSVGTLRVHPFRTCHDTADPVGFLITDGHRTFGYCTDTGRITRLIEHHLLQCHGLVLEANHDPVMLRNGPYPLALQQRVRSSQGHLANGDTCDCLDRLLGNKLSTLVLAHLSETNNHPELVRDLLVHRFGDLHRKITLVLAHQDQPTALLAL